MIPVPDTGILPHPRPSQLPYNAKIYVFIAFSLFVSGWLLLFQTPHRESRFTAVPRTPNGEAMVSQRQRGRMRRVRSIVKYTKSLMHLCRVIEPMAIKGSKDRRIDNSVTKLFLVCRIIATV